MGFRVVGLMRIHLQLALAEREAKKKRCAETRCSQYLNKREAQNDADDATDYVADNLTERFARRELDLAVVFAIDIG